MRRSFRNGIVALSLAALMIATESYFPDAGLGLFFGLPFAVVMAFAFASTGSLIERLSWLTLSFVAASAWWSYHLSEGGAVLLLAGSWWLVSVILFLLVAAIEGISGRIRQRSRVT